MLFVILRYHVEMALIVNISFVHIDIGQEINF